MSGQLDESTCNLFRDLKENRNIHLMGGEEALSFEKTNEIFEKTLELMYKGVQPKAAAFVISYEYGYPIRNGDFLQEELENAYEKAAEIGIPQRDYIERVANVLTKRGFTDNYKELVTKISESINNGEYGCAPRTNAARAAYDYLKEKKPKASPKLSNIPRIFHIDGNNFLGCKKNYQINNENNNGLNNLHAYI